MHGTTTSVRASGRLSGTGAQHDGPEVDPAWRPWLRLIDRALTAAEDPEWERLAIEPHANRASDAPLLHGAVLRVDTRQLRRLLRDLLREADRAEEEGAADERGSGAPRPTSQARARRLDAVGALAAAMAHDAEAIERAAKSVAVDAERFAVVSNLAAMPILRACASRLREQIPESWMRGYCPICGAWPALAELRGLERSRRLRCGRCASDWPIPVLRCPFCDELRHDRLRSLLPEGDEQTRRVDTCDTCKGYVKSFSTLQAMPPRTLATMDLATVALDMVAVDRGYARPSRPAFAVRVTISRPPARPVTIPSGHE
jgi:FdhE protein